MVQHDKRPVIGVVVPIYNPPLGWQYNTTAHMLLLKQLAPKYQFKFLLINDGSRDDIDYYLAGSAASSLSWRVVGQ